MHREMYRCGSGFYSRKRLVKTLKKKSTINSRY
jgi:hypothetical protein